MNCLSESGAQRLRPAHNQPLRPTLGKRPIASRAREKTRDVLWAVTLLWILAALQGNSLLAQQPPQGRQAQQTPKPGQAAPPPQEITFSTRLDRTAVWVGDQFIYTIIVEHSPNIEFVLDNLSKETINMDPFQVADVSKPVTTLKNGDKRLILDLTLSSFAAGIETEQIPQLTLFYFRRDQGTGGVAEAAAESLTVPGPVIALRSTLPPEPRDIRDAFPATYSWAESRWVLAVAGGVGLVLLVAGVGWETATYVRRIRSRKGPDRRKAMEAVRARWASAVPSDFNDSDTIIAFHNQSYQDVKEYIGYYLEVPTLGLTADELQEEMQRLGTQSDFSQKVAGVLKDLETSRYSLNGARPNPEVAQRTSQQIREIFASSSKR
ncbi:MAG: hypothetical protein A3H27_19145 [Acidobacteria bacterium RIFCSPLOWO2_02_FULL_59_13]|nr:MAG: hypothetical protein A3H27_19145 [Acidobacteria bacterium RIFCSPLOWO2_02_FULL_59_13]